MKLRRTKPTRPCPCRFLSPAARNGRRTGNDFAAQQTSSSAGAVRLSRSWPPQAECYGMDASRLSATIVARRRRKACHLTYLQLILGSNRSTSTASQRWRDHLAEDQSRQTDRGDRRAGACGDGDGGLRQRALLGPAVPRRGTSDPADQSTLREAVSQDRLGTAHAD